METDPLMRSIGYLYGKIELLLFYKKSSQTLSFDVQVKLNRRQRSLFNPFATAKDIVLSRSVNAEEPKGRESGRSPSIKGRYFGQGDGIKSDFVLNSVNMLSVEWKKEDLVDLKMESDDVEVVLEGMKMLRVSENTWQYQSNDCKIPQCEYIKVEINHEGHTETLVTKVTYYFPNRKVKAFQTVFAKKRVLEKM
jgi:hypothetical protein